MFDEWLPEQFSSNCELNMPYPVDMSIFIVITDETVKCSFKRSSSLLSCHSRGTSASRSISLGENYDVMVS